MRRFFLILQLAINGLATNKVRSLLTTLGIIIGIASVITMLSIGQGAQDDILESINLLGTNVINIRPGAELQEVEGSTVEPLTETDLEFLANTDRFTNIVEISPVCSGGAIIRNRENEYTSSVMGVSESYDQITTVDLQTGRFLNVEDIRGRRKVIILNATLAEELFPGEEFSDVLGKKVSVGDVKSSSKYKVIGILAQSDDDNSGMGARFSEMDTLTYIPYTTASKLLFMTDNISMIKIKTLPESLDLAVYEIKRKFLKFRGVEEENFTIFTSEDLLDTVTEITGIFTTLLASIAAISLLVGGIGISNIMLVSVTERTREIGLRKAVGARKSDVLLQFLFEAVFLTLFGGIIGIIVGIVGGALIAYFSGLTSSVAISHVLLSTCVSTFIGIVFGFLPANKASQLDPIDALRYE